DLDDPDRHEERAEDRLADVGRPRVHVRRDDRDQDPDDGEERHRERREEALAPERGRELDADDRVREASGEPAPEAPARGSGGAQASSPFVISMKRFSRLAFSSYRPTTGISRSTSARTSL